MGIFEPEVAYADVLIEDYGIDPAPYESDPGSYAEDPGSYADPGSSDYSSYEEPAGSYAPTASRSLGSMTAITVLLLAVVVIVGAVSYLAYRTGTLGSSSEVPDVDGGKAADAVAN